MDALVTEFKDEQRKQLADLDRQSVRKKGYVGMAAAGIACAAAWFAPMSPPRHTVELPERFNMASARITLVLAARRIESFQAQYKRLPSTLADAGVHEPLMRYERPKDGAFIVRVPVGQGFLTFDSSMAPAMYTEDVKTILQATGR